jgi:hypothetical protein
MDLGHGFFDTVLEPAGQFLDPLAVFLPALAQDPSRLAEPDDPDRIFGSGPQLLLT